MGSTPTRSLPPSCRTPALPGGVRVQWALRQLTRCWSLEVPSGPLSQHAAHCLRLDCCCCLPRRRPAVHLPAEKAATADAIVVHPCLLLLDQSTPVANCLLALWPTPARLPHPQSHACTHFPALPPHQRLLGLPSPAPHAAASQTSTPADRKPVHTQRSERCTRRHLAAASLSVDRIRTRHRRFC